MSCGAAAVVATAVLATAALVAAGCSAPQSQGGGAPKAPGGAAGALVNGRAAPRTSPLRPDAGDVVETRDAGVEIRTAEGTWMRLAARSVLENQGVKGGTEHWFLSAGSAEGEIGPRTSLGARDSWAVAQGRDRARVRVSIAGEGAAAASVFRALAGAPVLRYHSLRVHLPEACEVALTPSADGPDSIGIAAAASNPASVEASRKSGELTHEAFFPAASAGAVAERGSATRVVCLRAEAWSPVVLRLAPASEDGVTARLAPAAAALLQGSEIRLDVPALGRGRLDGLRSQTAEFLPGGDAGR